MDKTKIVLGATALILGGLALAPRTAEAYRGDPAAQGPNCTPERHEAMTQAFENNDFAAWKNLMRGRGRVTQVVNEGNFARFAEMHKLRLEGKTDEANRVRTELGLGIKDGSGKGQGNGYGRNAR